MSHWRKMTSGRLAVTLTTSGITLKSEVHGLRQITDAQLVKPSVWTVPDCPQSRSILSKFNIGEQSSISALMDARPKTYDLIPWSTVQIPEYAMAGLWGGVSGFQADALRWMEYRGGNGLLSDDVGLGKTIEALAWVRWKNPKTVLFIVTASTKDQWVARHREWLPNRKAPQVLEGKTPHVLDPERDAVINWDILVAWTGTNSEKQFYANGVIPKVDWGCIVADEAVRLGNPDSGWSRAVRWLVRRGCPSFLPMTYTPMRTCPDQFWTVLNLLEPQAFPNHWQYRQRYCRPRMGRNGKMVFDGATNQEELRELVAPLFLRREKRDVIKDMPPMMPPQIVPLPKDPRFISEMEAAEEGLDELVRLRASRTEIENQIAMLSRSAFDCKKDGVMEWVHRQIAQGDKVILFCWHRPVIEWIKEQLGAKATVYYGGLSPKARRSAIERFTTGTASVFVGQILSCGEGLDGLQHCCSHVAFVESLASPAMVDQAVGRVDRIGQTMPVRSTFLSAVDSRDDGVMRTLARRGDVLSYLMDGPRWSSKIL